MNEELATKMSEDVVNARRELLKYVHDHVSAITDPNVKVMTILGFACGAATLLNSSRETMPKPILEMLNGMIETFKVTDAEAIALDAAKPMGGRH